MLKSKYNVGDILLVDVWGQKNPYKMLVEVLGFDREFDFYTLYRFDRAYIISYKIHNLEANAKLIPAKRENIELLYGKAKVQKG